MTLNLARRRVLTAATLSLIVAATFWAGTSVEYGNVWENRDDIDFGDGFFAGSLFLGAHTVFGPLFFGYGLAEGGAGSFYVYLGPTRDGPALQ